MTVHARRKPASPPRAARVQGLSRERAQRLRIAWFVLGTLFGLVASSLGRDYVFDRESFDEGPPVAENESDDSAVPNERSEAPPPSLPPIAMEDQAWPRTVDVTIASGDTIPDLLVEQGLTHEAAGEVMRELKRKFNTRDLRVGHTVSMIFDHDDKRQERDAAELAEMNIILNNLEQIRLRQLADGSYDAEKMKKKVHIESALGGSRITSSFYMAAKRSGVPDSVILDLIKNYSYDVDFQRDIHAGDEVQVVYEAMVTEDGIKVGTGKVLYAMLRTGGKDKKLYRFETADGSSRYYNELGESIIKQLLRTPVDGARISSGFGMRKHPVLGFSRMHRGVDFAAPMGTPIYAAGDGVIEFAGPAGGYGNYIKIKHNATWESGYGHMTRFGRGIHKGQKVRQGDVIAYVGMAGTATGPHLHYELIKYGAKVNPAGVQMAGSNKLEGRDYAAFRTQQKKISSDIARLETAKTKEMAAQ